MIAKGVACMDSLSPAVVGVLAPGGRRETKEPQSCMHNSLDGDATFSMWALGGKGIDGNWPYRRRRRSKAIMCIRHGSIIMIIFCLRVRITWTQRSRATGFLWGSHFQCCRLHICFLPMLVGSCTHARYSYTAGAQATVSGKQSRGTSSRAKWGSL